MKLSEDLKKAVETLDSTQARYLADTYYQMQDFRIQAQGQIRAIQKGMEEKSKDEDGERRPAVNPHAVLDWWLEQVTFIENQLKVALTKFARKQEIGQWMMAQVGIGPVITAGLIGHLDIKEAPTCGHFWNFAGFNPGVKWLGTKKAKDLIGQHEDWEVEKLAGHLARKTGMKNLPAAARKGKKGEPVKMTRATLAAALARRPWNAKLKTLCYKLGESFVKTQNLEGAFYGRHFAARKAAEIARNDEGGYAGHAKEKTYSRSTEAWAWVNGCYPAGICADLAPLDLKGRAQLLKTVKLKPGEGQVMLPPAHIHAIARRWVIKLFLSHLHQVWYKLEFGEEAPRPYAIAVLEHGHMIEPPETEGF